MKPHFVVIFVAGFTWAGLWRTPDQQGQHLMDQGHFEAAAKSFQNPMRQGIAWYRAGEFEKAEASFARVATPEAEFNRGNALVLLGEYEAAVERYDRALQLRPGWEPATTNREIAAARAERLEQTGGDMGDQKIGADEIVFDRKNNQDGQETEVDGGQPLSDAEMQALWLRRVQTKPADFLKAKFAYQSANPSEGGNQ